MYVFTLYVLIIEKKKKYKVECYFYNAGEKFVKY